MTGVLKALTSPGVWVPVAGAPLAPVYVGTDMPDDTYDLWFDTDEVAGDVLTQAELFEYLPSEHSAVGIAGTTTGTVELTVATLNVPARSKAGTLTARCFVRVQKSVATENFVVRLKVDGTVACEAQTYQNSVYEFFTLIGVSSIAVNTAAVLTTAVQRLTGAGTATAIATFNQNHLQATYTPDRT